MANKNTLKGTSNFETILRSSFKKVSKAPVKKPDIQESEKINEIFDVYPPLEEKLDRPLHIFGYVSITD